MLTTGLRQGFVVQLPPGCGKSQQSLRLDESSNQAALYNPPIWQAMKCCCKQHQHSGLDGCLPWK